MNELYIRIIKEIKNLKFFLKFFNFKILIKYLNHKFLIFLNYKKYDKKYLDDENLKFSNKWFKYNLLDWLYIFDKKIDIRSDKKIKILEIKVLKDKALIFFKIFQTF